MNQKIIKLFILFFSSSIHLAAGQDILQQYVNIALENNKQLLNRQLDVLIAEEQLKSARGKFLPEVFLDASYTWADGGRTINIPAGDLINPAYKGLNQLVGEDLYPTNIPNTNEQLLPNNFHETKLRLIQPVFNSSIYFNYKANEAQISISEAKLKAYEDQLIKEIRVAYYKHLISIDQLKILEQSYELLHQLLSYNRSLVENHKSTKDVVYSIQAELADLQSKIIASKNRKILSGNYFNHLIGRSFEEPILIDSTYVNSIDTSLKSLTEYGLINRPELSIIHSQLLWNNSIVRLHKSYILPEVNLIGDLGYQGFEYTFNTDQEFWFVRLSLKWSLFNGFENLSQVQKSKMVSEKMQNELDDLKSKIKLEISQAVYAYNEAYKLLQASQESLRYSKEHFNMVSKKYQHGQALLIELNQARAKYTSSLLDEVIAKYNIKIKEAELEAAANLTIEKL